ncbi:YdeI/OmpD-associated family protein [Gaoshiqia sp. Z1-71]|uniref:YdeI/OmpD-associated family protein n=1 Tax=Gaoshiqia hydrogeniformans TaxID=3290090 RepID=UPI003BF83730
MEKPLVNNKYILEKFPGKGGWTYAAIPEIRPDKKAPFGWIKVKGQIDGFAIKSYHLMPMGNGQLFLPVKAEIRKKIGKKEGDRVHVVLYRDTTPVEIPEELLTCLRDEPEAYEAFLSCTDGEKKAVVDWIYSAKQEGTKVERIAKTINKLANRGE